MTMIVVSDIHGNMTTLERLAGMQAAYPHAQTVFLGDYVDGHPYGGRVLEAIRQQVSAGTALAVRGNHDQLWLNFMQDGDPALWFQNGGEATLQQMQKDFAPQQHATSAEALRAVLQEPMAAQTAFVAQMPTAVSFDHLLLIHAGLDLSLDDPLQDTTALDRMWVREAYLYDQHESDPDGMPIFAHNPLPQTLITGHTPTGLVYGAYADEAASEMPRTPLGQGFFKNPIKVIQYPHEAPRYLIDGGNHMADPHNYGNIAVFDETTGQLIASDQGINA